MARNQWILYLTLIVLGLAGCSGAPHQIATYPQEKPVAVAGYPASENTVYKGYLELKVKRAEASAKRAVQLTEDHGGYLSTSQAWWVDGAQQISLELRVPVANFDQLYIALRCLGAVRLEHVHEHWNGSGDGWSTYAQITLLLSGTAPAWSNLTLGNWRPLNTLQQAWDVFTTLFGFLVDVLIWILVVVGPFALLGWGAHKLYQRLHK